MTTLTALRIEGNLLPPDLAAELSADLKGQAPPDFGLAKTDKLEDAIALAWGEAKDYWSIFQRRLAQLPEDDPATSLTREYWILPLLKLLGYDPVYQPRAEVVGGRTYALSHRAEPGDDKPPIHTVGYRVDLGTKPPTGRPRLSAHGLVQEYLNATEHLWAIATNGRQWRLLRDCSLMTRQSYVEFDLEQILNGENFAEFSLFYRLFHRTRLPQGLEDADDCLLEYYHQEALQQGGRVRDRLRDGVEQALLTLGNGLLEHRKSTALRQALTAGELDARGFYRQLLRLIYRLLFLMVAEARELLFAGEDLDKARIYRSYYSLERLRLLAEQQPPRRDGYQDLWQGLRATFALFETNWRSEFLGLSPLNGDLFGEGTLGILDRSALENYHLLLALHSLSLYTDKNQLRRVNYGALDVEELGSVYESLLDFTPEVKQEQGIWQFSLVTGTERKTTGSYYTPSALVAQLIESALEPVMAAKLQEARGMRESEYAPLTPDSRLPTPKTPPTPHSPLPTPEETALLSLKICDPACGSGHFLLAAARRLGKELARIRTGESQPGPEVLRRATRDVIQNCIYGVDLNPLAVDLCKVALWIEGFARGLPLNFLDHRIKCGNSLVGVFDLACLREGVPDNAFKPVTGDEKSVAQAAKKDNKRQRGEAPGQLGLFDALEDKLPEYAAAWRELGELPETTPEGVNRKAALYRQRHGEQNAGWWQDLTACNLWTAAFFMPLTAQNLQLLPTTAALRQVMQGRGSALAAVRAANELAEKYRFFHWSLEFPEVFEQGGFDCVLGNPPWEMLQIAEKEFFAARDYEIATAQNKAAREKLIKTLPERKPELAQQFEQAKYQADAQNRFIRESARFQLTAVGKLNTYAMFSELARDLIAGKGRSGIIVPTGIATDDTCKQFFGDLTQRKNLVSLYDFENREKLFADVDSRMKFVLLVTSKSSTRLAKFAFFLTQPKQIDQPNRTFELSPDDIALMNPNTLTCPVFRTAKDAELTTKIYQQVPVLENEKTQQNPWGITFRQGLFNMSSDSGLFQNEPGEGLLPLYEAKMFHQFDHRWATFSPNGDTRNLEIQEKEDNHSCILPRYWVKSSEMENRLRESWNKEWLLAFRDVTNATNERTAIFSILPKVAVGHTAPILFSDRPSISRLSCLIANLNSIIFDFVARQKMGGTHLTFTVLRQLPVLPPDRYSPADIDYIAPRVLELAYTAWDIKPFADDLWRESGVGNRESEGSEHRESAERLRQLFVQQWEANHGRKLEPNTLPHPSPDSPLPPFRWDENRRAILRAELDAYYARLYGLTRDELRYILDPADLHGPDFPSETFRVLKNNEIKKYGEYRTQRLVLAAWDMLSF